MTFGEDRVRINPSDNSRVSQIKQKSAELIDLCDTMPKPEDLGKVGEFNRLRALAMTHYEDAAMWAVKAVTI